MKNPMFFWAALCLTLLLHACADQKKDLPYQERTASEEMAMNPQDEIARGEYLVRTIGCDHCHSPKKMTPQGPVPDMELLLSGYPSDRPLPEIEANPGQWVLFHPELTAAVGPWGTSFAGNLTSDDTGIGSWSLEQFDKAVRQGKFKGMDQGRPMMPPMPVYKDLTDDDLKAIFAYLKSTRPVENVVPSYRPPSQAGE